MPRWTQPFGEFLKGNPELAKPTGRPGSGTPANTGNGNTTVVSTDSYMANRAKDLASGDIKIIF